MSDGADDILGHSTDERIHLVLRGTSVELQPAEGALRLLRDGAWYSRGYV